MLQYNPTISGSLNITGSLIISNGMIGTVNGVDVQVFSSSISQVVTNIQTTTGSQSGRLTSIESFTSSVSTTNTFTASASTRLNSIETITASNVARLNSIETITSSNIARLNAVETITASNIARLTSLEITTGSLATTGSNTFIGTQTITGSLFISSNLVVQGTSSLQNITASAVSIGTNIVNLNTANPAIRYAGLSIGDSGSIGSSGSFLYDSVQDEMIFIHRGTSTVVTSSVTLMGPQTFDNIGNETYPSINLIQKGTGNEHLVDSCIFDNGTTTCIKNNLIATGTSCFGNTIASGGDITITKASSASFIANNTSASGKSYRLVSTDSGQFIIQNTGILDLATITSTGIACFASTICGGTINSSGQGLFSDYISVASSTGGQSTFWGGICISNNKCAYFSGNVGIGIIPNGPGLRLAQDFPLRLEGSSTANNDNALTIGGFGLVSVDSPGVGGGRFRITNSGHVGIGTTAPNKVNVGRTLSINTCQGAAGIELNLSDSNSPYYHTFDGTNVSAINMANGWMRFGNNNAEYVRISNSGTFGINCTGVAARTMVVKGVTGCYIVAEFIEPAGVHSIEIYPNKNSTNHISSDYMSGGAYLPLSLSGRECSTDLLLGTNGRVGIGSGANKGILTVYDSGCTVDRGIPAFDTQAKGIELHNYNSGTTDNVIGLWISTGPHKAGIASGRTNAASTWEVDLRFYTHPTTIGNLDSTCENMRLYGDGSLVTRGGASSPGLYSDINLKENLSIIPSALNKIKCINGYTFDWKDTAPARSNPSLLNIIHDAGLIAQEVESILPDIVRDNDLSCIKMLNYNGVIALLVEGMKEQQCTIDTLKSCLGIS